MTGESNSLIKGILIFGPNGSGKTTLGRELANMLNIKHMDIEDYYFMPSEIPYSVTRPREEYIELMIDDIKKHRQFVLSAVTGDFGDDISKYYKLAVYISAPREERLKRVEKRAYDKHGERVAKGGDMYEQQIKFNDFVAARSIEPIEQWSKTLCCPIIQIDGMIDLQTNVARIAEQFYVIN